MILCDVFITTKGRPDTFKKSFESFIKNTPRDQYRLTVVEDTGLDNPETKGFYPESIDHLILHRANLGLGPSINQALSYIDALKKWDGDKAPYFTAYLQDDVLYSPGWLQRLTTMYMLMKDQHKLGFVSGIESIEHPIRQSIGNGMILKDWIRATCMIAPHDYWMSMWPISRIDPETGMERGKPNNGMGSGVDWWFIRNHPNSVCKTGRTNLIIPGLLQHMGFDCSTWLNRSLPESESDIRKIRAK